MFGMPCLKRENGKVVAGHWKDGGINVKLVDEAAREQALALPGVELFDPGMGRAMKEWVLVPKTLSDDWLRLVEQASRWTSRSLTAPEKAARSRPTVRSSRCSRPLRSRKRRRPPLPQGPQRLVLRPRGRARVPPRRRGLHCHPGLVRPRAAERRPPLPEQGRRAGEGAQPAHAGRVRPVPPASSATCGRRESSPTARSSSGTTSSTSESSTV